MFSLTVYFDSLVVVLAAGGSVWLLSLYKGDVCIVDSLSPVSGVTLLEKDIGKRRPAYAEYIRRTNAFFPGKPK
jgi:steroid 5-alpha reductase family enzyme